MVSELLRPLSVSFFSLFSPLVNHDNGSLLVLLLVLLRLHSSILRYWAAVRIARFFRLAPPGRAAAGTRSVTLLPPGSSGRGSVLRQFIRSVAGF